MNPSDAEGEKAFISRCIEHEVGRGREQDQASAVCYAMWDRATLERKRRPKVYETQEAFITRFRQNHPEASIAHALAMFKLGPGGA
jgi:hypothetical protein